MDRWERLAENRLVQVVIMVVATVVPLAVAWLLVTRFAE
jgi:hypothetical protein